MQRLVLTILLIGGTACVAQEKFGKFVGRVVAEWNPDGRTMTLREPFGYVDPDGLAWSAPKGSQVDGASIPRVAWTLIGGPFEGQYRSASVIHDVACVERKQSWRKVHRVFYTAMRAAGVSETQAKIMYAAVFHFGPRWGTDPPAYTLAEMEFPALAESIRRREEPRPGAVDPGPPLSLEDIETYIPLR